MLTCEMHHGAEMIPAMGVAMTRWPSLHPLPPFLDRSMGALLCRRAALRMEQDFSLEAPPPAAPWVAHNVVHGLRPRPPPATLLEACLRAFAEQPEHFERGLLRIPQARPTGARLCANSQLTQQRRPVLTGPCTRAVL